MFDYKKALKYLTKSLEIKENSFAYGTRGTAYFLLGRYDEAFNDFKRAVELNPRNAGANNFLGLCYERKGNYEEAIECFSKAISMKKKSSYFKHRAKVYKKLGKPEKAKEDFETAAALGPDKPTIEKLDIGDIKSAFVLDPNNPCLYYLRGMYNMGIYKPYEALNDLNKSLELNPNNIDALKARGDLLIGLGKRDEGNEDLERAKMLKKQLEGVTKT